MTFTLLLVLFAKQNDQVKEDDTAGRVVCMGVKRNACRFLVGKADENIPLGRPRRRWEDNIKMERINLTQDTGKWRALVNAVMNLRPP
jgi:hypothetical protein